MVRNCNKIIVLIKSSRNLNYSCQHPLINYLSEKDYNDATPSEELKDIKIKLTTNGSPTSNNAEDVENQKEDIHCPS